MSDPTRKTVAVCVWTTRWGEHDYPAGNKLDALIDRLCRARDEIPDEFRASATIETFSDFGLMGMEVGFSRPETDGEMGVRIAREAARDDRSFRSLEERERILLAALRRKYPDEPSDAEPST
jgi:hypothetical protein